MEIDPQELQRISDLIECSDSPVGIDARKTHIIIIHKLEQIEKRLSAIERTLARHDAP